MRRSTVPLMALAALASLPLGTAPASAVADRAAPQGGAVADRLTDTLARRLFPLLNAVAHSDRLPDLVAGRQLAQVLADRTARRNACGKGFKDTAGAVCEARAMLWSDAETSILVGAIEAMHGLDAVRPDDGIAAQARREIDGVNSIIHVYALGVAPAYPSIDGPGIPMDGQEAQTRLRAALTLGQTPRAGALRALDPAMEFALALLDAHDRTDAAGFEPITGGLNAPAFARAKALDWSRYRYTALIVPGSGPEVPEMALSQLGKLRVRLAADRFAAGDVPFIIVSGGRAHPRATPFTEAVEMRRALIERYGIPADAIVIEPYARHTTTNLRNATRLLMAMRAPLKQDALIVSSVDQTDYIADAGFLERNRKELGYEPGRLGRRFSPEEIEFRPSLLSARIAPRDPLDP
jgi:hypothetical protein